MTRTIMTLATIADVKANGKDDDKSHDELTQEIENSVQQLGTDYTFKRKIVWFNAIGFLLLHLAALYGLYLCLYASVATFLFAVFLSYASGQGVTMGAHRLFAHKSYKASFHLRLILIILQTIAGQNCMYIWVRDHRQHHRYSDTDADPHNASRGFFFSHVGWLMSKKHPLVIEKGKTIDMRDLEQDSLVMLQKKYYKILYAIFAIGIPISIPVYYWQETWWNSLFICYFARYLVMLNITWMVNSWAHFFGYKPYDKRIKPVESRLVSVLTSGEGWHNYHHTFPWDYKTSELGSLTNFTTHLINLCAFLGLAHDLKVAPVKMVDSRVLRTGDAGCRMKTVTNSVQKSVTASRISNGSHFTI